MSTSRNCASPTRRGTKRAGIAMALAALALLAGCQQELQGQLGESDANDMLDVLLTAGIPAEKESQDGRVWSVSVEGTNLQKALHAVKESGLPRQKFASLGDLFKKEGLVSSPSEERVRYLFAISQELSQTLAQIDGVITARVHPVIPQNDPLVDKVRPSSASIFIKCRRGANLEAMAPAIKNLVMRGIEGLSYDNISLTFVTAEEPPRALQSTLAGPSWSTGPAVIIFALTALLAAALAGIALLSNRLRQQTRLPPAAPAHPLHSEQAPATSSNSARFHGGRR